ncbi:hypothetical protein LIN78_16405 [Leeia sp. TBRC 13508]|uniref:Uncharacterized protein n=1 Tax=Leeia speluncae TaxID=2884804 RepID=A0ABS8DA97_9NEIS|nr:hypothetical protein [Leeia speluncae]MCB6185131.1 hypothetical protein [Leeia speluncae]
MMTSKPTLDLTTNSTEFEVNINPDAESGSYNRFFYLIEERAWLVESLYFAIIEDNVRVTAHDKFADDKDKDILLTDKKCYRDVCAFVTSLIANGIQSPVAIFYMIKAEFQDYIE